MSTDSSTVISADKQSVLKQKENSETKKEDSRHVTPVVDIVQSPIKAGSSETKRSSTQKFDNPQDFSKNVTETSSKTIDAETKERNISFSSFKAFRKNTSARNSDKLTWDRYLVRVLAVISAVILWQLCSSFNVNFIVNFENIPAPDLVGEKFVLLLNTPEFYKHILVSLQRIAISFSMAVVLGIIAGVLMGRSRMFSDIMLPYIEILRPIPAVAWIPLAILMFPTEESSIIYITFLGAFFPIVLNTVHGVEQTEENLVRAAKSLGASNRAILWHVVLPGALPSIMAGLAIGMGVSWFSLLAGEIISGQYGIGYFTWNSYTLVEYPNIIIGMLTIGGLGTLSTWLVKKSSKPALRWQETHS